ncbi:MAG: PLP-dependent aminotransferase family protein [Peptostreptococcaceae bacterium]|nr:PLP-dependent aminotransferase family protein [Peptostreptococcaceae bacterium]
MIINWKPNKDINKALYIQIVEYFEKMISTGYFVCGEKLPSQRKLAEILNVNRSTIIIAMDELKSKGFIKTNGKGGTVVSSNNWLNLNKNNILKNLLSSGLLKRKNKIYESIEKYKTLIKVDFGKGELDQSLYPDIKMQDKMLEAIKEIGYLPYGNNNGDEKLIKKIENKMISMGIDMDDNEILIVSGATQGLFITVLGMLSNQNIIKTNIPCYIKSLEIFKSAGLNIQDINRENKGLYNVFYMIPTFHNPTGSVMNSYDREKFMNFYGKNNPIIEDDVFRELWYDFEPPKPLKAYSYGQNVIYINSFSKILAPGLRIGWICASKEIIGKLREIKYQMDSGTSIINQKIVLKWLNTIDYDKNLLSIRKSLKNRRGLIEKILNDEFKNLFLWNKPNGGYYYWLKSTKKIKALKVFEKALEKGLVIHPGDLYGEIDSTNIRISFAGSNKSQIKLGFKILKEVMLEL